MKEIKSVELEGKNLSTIWVAVHCVFLYEMFIICGYSCDNK